MIGWRSKPQAVVEDKPNGFDAYELRLGDLMRGERATIGKSLLDVQRDLKIKATYIAAIENADISVFESPGFVAGYVRSYARYLGMDPVECFRRFCEEANFTPANGSTALGSGAPLRKSRARVEGGDPLLNLNPAFIPKGESVFSRIQPGAVASLVVLAGLLGAIGYGGWSILQEVQRVQLAPVEQAPSLVVQIEPLQEVAPNSPQLDVATAPSLDPMERLYRPQALDVPVMVSRNGPIGSIDPNAPSEALGGETMIAQVAPQIEEALVQVTEVRQGVEILAVSPAWVRVSAADGTVLFEKILDSCERYAVPAHETPAQLRTGNAGGVFFVVNGVAHGPAGAGGGVVKGVSLAPDALSERFAATDLTAHPDLAELMTASLDANASIELPANCSIRG